MIDMDELEELISAPGSLGEAERLVEEQGLEDWREKKMESSDLQKITDILDKRKIPYQIFPAKGCIIVNGNVTLGFNSRGELLDVLVL